MPNALNPVWKARIGPFHQQRVAVERAQRIDVAVERTIAAAGHFGPDQRQRLLHVRGPQHLHLVVGRAGLVVHPLDEVGALAEFVIAEGEVKAAILLQADVETGLLRPSDWAGNSQSATRLCLPRVERLLAATTHN